MIFFPAISTTVLSTMCLAALLSTPFRCLGAVDISSFALCTEKMVVFSTPDAVVPAVHLFLPRLTREPIVSEPMRKVARAHALDDAAREERAVKLARDVRLRARASTGARRRQHLRERAGGHAPGFGLGNAVVPAGELQLLDVLGDVSFLLELEEAILLRLAHGFDRGGHRDAD